MVQERVSLVAEWQPAGVGAGWRSGLASWKFPVEGDGSVGQAALGEAYSGRVAEVAAWKLNNKLIRRVRKNWRYFSIFGLYHLYLIVPNWT